MGAILFKWRDEYLIFGKRGGGVVRGEESGGQGNEIFAFGGGKFFFLFLGPRYLRFVTGSFQFSHLHFLLGEIFAVSEGKSPLAEVRFQPTPCSRA